MSSGNTPNPEPPIEYISDGELSMTTDQFGEPVIRRVVARQRVEPDPTDPRIEAMARTDLTLWSGSRFDDLAGDRHREWRLRRCAELLASADAVDPARAELRAALECNGMTDKMRSTADLCSRSGAVCGNALYAEIVRLRAEVTDLRQQLAKVRTLAAAKIPAIIATLESAKYSLALGRVELGRVDPALGIAAAITELSALVAAGARALGGAAEQTEPQPTMSRRYDELLTETGTPHDHREHVPGCFRCDLSEDELGVAGLSEPQPTPVAEWDRPHPFVRVDDHVSCGVCGTARNQNFGQHIYRRVEGQQ